MTEESLEEFASNEEKDALYKSTIVRLQKQLVQSKAKSQDMVEACYSAAYDAAMVAYLTKPKAEKPPKDKRKGLDEEIALWHLTDWQGAKKTTSYDSSVMYERVMLYCDKAEAITNMQRKVRPVRSATIMFGGDMIEGMFNFPGQVFEIDSTLFEQWLRVSDLIKDVVLRALSLYEEVTVVAEWGNHGRIGSKRDNVPRSDNFDRMCYESARRLLEGHARLNWQDCPEDVQRVEIGNYRALLIHGDEVGRNGFASPGTIVQHMNRWKSGAYPWDFRDVYIGHYHTHAEWAMANGSGAVYQTGSTESDNRYAGVNLAASAVPSQRLHFVDPDKGRVTSQYKIWLA